MWLILFGGFSFGKMWKNMEKKGVFRADTAGLGKYCMGGCDRIGVERVNLSKANLGKTCLWQTNQCPCLPPVCLTTDRRQPTRVLSVKL